MTTFRAQRILRLLPALVLLLVPLRLGGQQRATLPSSWADEVLRQESYQQPPKELADAVLAPRQQNVTLSGLSPDKKWFLEETPDGPVEMKTFSKPFHELGGLFVDFKANRARSLTVRNNVSVQLISSADGSKKPIQIPAGARVTNATWSPDGAAVAFFVHTDDATHIWVADTASGKSRQLTRTPVLATLVTTFAFTSEGRQIAFVQIPENRGPMPAAPAAPTGPTVKIADSDKNRLRTFPSLMTTPYEKELLEWHATGQLALVDVQKSAVKKIGQPAMIRSLDPSPDARFVRVTRMVKPFSYDVPVTSFGSIDEIWDVDGKVLAKVSDRPIDMGVQDDTAPPPDPAAGGGRGQNQQGKREIAWRSDNQGLTYLEQEPVPAGEAGRGRAGRGTAGDGAGAPAADSSQDEPGRGGRAPQRKDRLYHWLPPFGEASRTVLYENSTRMTERALFARPADAVLQRARGAEHDRVRRRSLGHDEALHAGAIPRRRRVREPRVAAVDTRNRERRRPWRRAGWRRARWLRRRDRARPTLRRQAVGVPPGFDLRPESERGRAEDVHRQGRDQDRREAARLRKRQQGRVRARLRA